MKKRKVLTAALVTTSVLWPWQKAEGRAQAPVAQSDSASCAPPPIDLEKLPLPTRALPQWEPDVVPPLSSLDSAPLPQASSLPALHKPFSLDGLTLRFDMAELVKRIRQNEGLRLYPYKDQVHITTIAHGLNLEKPAIRYETGDVACYNPNYKAALSGEEIWNYAAIPEDFRSVLESVRNKSVKKRVRISQQSAEALFTVSVEEAIAKAAAYFRYFNDWDAEHQMAAVDLAYNIGDNLRRHPEFLAAANAEQGPDEKRMARELMNMDYRHSERAKHTICVFDPDMRFPSVHKPHHSQATLVRAKSHSAGIQR